MCMFVLSIVSLKRVVEDVSTLRYYNEHSESVLNSFRNLTPCLRKGEGGGVYFISCRSFHRNFRYDRTVTAVAVRQVRFDYGPSVHDHCGRSVTGAPHANCHIKGVGSFGTTHGSYQCGVYGRYFTRLIFRLSYDRSDEIPICRRTYDCCSKRAWGGGYQWAAEDA